METPPRGNLARVSVVIPCHNEEESIKAVIEAIPRGVHEIVVVDNNCTDKTASIAKACGARVVPESTKGYGAALQAGFRSATGDIIAAFDGDNQYPAYAVRDLVDLLVENNFDFISTSRFPLQDRASMSTVSKVGNWGLTLAANILFNTRLADSQSGMWVFKRAILPQVISQSNDMPFSQELKIRAAVHPDISFAEYHIPYHPRLGKSKLTPFRHGVINLTSLFVLRIKLF